MPEQFEEQPINQYQEEGFDFNIWLQQVMNKAPWWAISLASHGLLFLIISVMSGDPTAGLDSKAVAYKKPEAPKEELEFTPPDFDDKEIEPEEEEEKPDITEDLEEEKTSDDIFANSPVNNDAVFEAIGIGAGSGVKGGRYGGRGSGKKKALAKNGGSGTENAVLWALRWLARHQNPDGSWSARDFSRNCKGQNGPCSGPGYEEHNIGVTALAVLAFLGAGYTHMSKDKYDGISFGDVVKKGLKWLIDIQDPDGCFGVQAGKFMYNHCIAALALAEAYGMTESALFKEAAQKGINFISVAQNPYLAWRYQVKPGDNDTSVTGWAVMAMKSARMSKDLVIPQTSFDGAFAWLKEVTDETYYSVGYTAKGTGKVYVKDVNENWASHEALTAVGMMCRIFINYDKTDPSLEGGARLLVKDLPIYDTSRQTEKPIDYYYWYYATLALFQYDGPDGKYWKGWNESMKSAIVPSQRQEKDGCSWGSWEVDVDRWAFEGGRVYTTAINALTLEIYYRYPGAFTGDTTKPKTGIKAGEAGVKEH